MNWLAGYLVTVSEYIKNETQEYIKNETQVVEKRKLASYLLYLKNHIKRVVCCMRKFCTMPWGKNLVLLVSRI